MSDKTAIEAMKQTAALRTEVIKLVETTALAVKEMLGLGKQVAALNACFLELDQKVAALETKGGRI